ncbi:MAG TPA: hypothetical protein PLB38_00630 [bacterium]|nr:hypothetical protein [bacterium]
MIQKEIVNQICSHADNEGSGYKNWYCGIASNPRERLFSDHNVSEKNSWWLYRNAQTEQNARDTEQYLLRLGFKGGDGGGDYTTIHVYAYKITNTTIE